MSESPSESFINTYRPPSPPPLTSLETAYGPTPYDINFCYPLPLSPHTGILESPRVRLTPFIPRLHASTYISQVLAHPELTAHFPNEHKSLEEFLGYVEYGVRRNEGWCLFAVMDKGVVESEGSTEPEGESTGEGGEGGREDEGKEEKEKETMAGVIGLIRSDPTNLSTEIGYVMTFPAFQRTHVTTHAVCILLRFALSVPPPPYPLSLPSQRAGAGALPPPPHPLSSDHQCEGAPHQRTDALPTQPTDALPHQRERPGALGLRRVEWRAYAGNEASVKAAVRMGFREEGIRRWYVALAEGKQPVLAEGKVPQPGGCHGGDSEGKEGQEGKEGKDGKQPVPYGEPRAGDPMPGRKRVDSRVLAMCCDDWEDGGRERVERLLARV